MRSIHHLGRHLIIALAAATVGGCATAASSPSTTPAPSPAPTDAPTTTAGEVTSSVEVHAQPGFFWDQPSYTARAGEITITVINDDEVFHQMQILQNAQPAVDTVWEVYALGVTAVETVTLAPGEYRIFCIVPGHEQMDAPLTVVP